MGEVLYDVLGHRQGVKLATRGRVPVLHAVRDHELVELLHLLLLGELRLAVFVVEQAFLEFGQSV